MAPPESTLVDFQQPSLQGDFDRSNYLTKIKDYVRKVETYDLTDRKSEAGSVR